MRLCCRIYGRGRRPCREFFMKLPAGRVSVGPAYVRAVLAGVLLCSLSACSLFFRPSSRDVPEAAVTRLPALPVPAMAETPEVARHIWNFMQRDPKFIPQAIARKNRHGPMLEKIFGRLGLPLELLNVAMIESGFRPDARSHAGAVGLWQFIPRTARHYGLTVNYLVDQRKDPVLSTVAAAKHLRSLYADYQDWYLALAAYNAGSGRINQAIRESGCRNFWTLSRAGYLSQETRDYVPRFIAVSLMQSGVRVRPVRRRIPG